MRFGPRAAARAAALLVLATAAGLFGARVAAPPDFADNDQEKPLAYALDLLAGRHVFHPFDDDGLPASKPPASVWAILLFAAPLGRPGRTTVYLSCLVCLALLAALVFHIGLRRGGWRTALFSALLVAVSPAAIRMAAITRSDPLFGLLVFASFVAGASARRGERSWIPFFGLASLATLTKGPLVFLLAGLPLFCVPRGSGRRGFAAGLAGAALLCGGWFALAVREGGPDVWRRLLGDELVGHAVSAFPGRNLLRVPLLLLPRFAPASLLLVPAGLRLLRNRTFADPEQRALWAYLAAGWLVFGLGGHLRADLLWPLAPAAALLAGEEAGARTRTWSDSALLAAAAAVSAAFCVLVFQLGERELGTNEKVRRTVAAMDAARRVSAETGGAPCVIHVRGPFTFFFALGRFEERVRRSLGRRALQRPDARALVALRPADARRLARKLEGSVRPLLPPDLAERARMQVLAHDPPTARDAVTVSEGRLRVVPGGRCPPLEPPALLRVAGLGAWALALAAVYLLLRPAGRVDRPG